MRRVKKRKIEEEKFQCPIEREILSLIVVVVFLSLKFPPFYFSSYFYYFQCNNTLLNYFIILCVFFSILYFFSKFTLLFIINIIISYFRWVFIHILFVVFNYRSIANIFFSFQYTEPLHLYPKRFLQYYRLVVQFIIEFATLLVFWQVSLECFNAAR